jgi:hypothetical protein
MLDIILLILQKDGSKSHLKETSVLQAIGETLESQSLWVLSRQALLKTALELFGKGVHRILVPACDEGHLNSLGAMEAQGYEILTQMDVLRFLGSFIQNSKSQTLKLRDGQSLAALLTATTCVSLMKESLVSLSSLDPLSKGLQELASGNLIAAPVLAHSTGSLIGTLALSDLKRFLSKVDDEFAQLQKRFTAYTVGDYIAEQQHMRKDSDVWKGYCSKNDALDVALSKMLTFGVHRVWLGERRGDDVWTAEGVLSLSDLFHFLHGFF